MQISWWTLLIQGANFLVLVWLLQRFLYRPVQEVIEKRRKMTFSAAAAAEKSKAEADAAKQRYEEALAGIDTDRKAVLEKARTEVDAERQKILEDARSAAAKKITEAEKTIQDERLSAREGLKVETTAIAVRLAKKLLSDLAGSIPNDIVLARLEAELGRLPPAERQRLDREIQANGAHVEIITARSLNPEEQQTWKSRLEKALEHPIDATFDCDPDVIAGSTLRLPHTVIRATWADQLAAAQEALLRGHDE